MMAQGAGQHENRQGRLVALVIAGAMLLWWLGPKLGLAGRFAILIDLAVLAAFIWAMVVSLRMWRHRQKQGK
jgi:predicted tellurium resistance membrane protein TerC